MLPNPNQDPGQTRNLMLALVAMLLLSFGYTFFFMPEVTNPPPEAGERADISSDPASPAQNLLAGNRLALSGQTGLQANRVPLANALMSGSLSRVGARIDQIELNRYFNAPKQQGGPIEILHRYGSSNEYAAAFTWRVEEASAPPSDALWELVEGNQLAPGQDVVLAWESEEGLRYQTRFSLDDSYLFTVEQQLLNQANIAVQVQPVALIRSYDPEQFQSMFISREGAVGADGSGTVHYLNTNRLGLPREAADNRNEWRSGQSDSFEVAWMGLADKYFLAGIIGAEGAMLEARVQRFAQSAAGLDYVEVIANQGDFQLLQPGESTEAEFRFFAGPKEIRTLDTYNQSFGDIDFDRAVDFGWFYRLTKPFLYLLLTFQSWSGSFGVAILILTVLVKLLLFPIAYRSYRSMARMRKLQPKMEALRERHGDDRQAMSQATMQLYREEKVNPVAGCLPVLLQIPIFFALYKTLFVTIEMRHASFELLPGWVVDLSAPDPTSILNLFGLLPWSVPAFDGLLAFISIGVWPILMGVTQWLQMQLSPKPTDPTQALVFSLLPVIFVFFLATFPAGLVIYWTWNNVLTTLQQLVINRATRTESEERQEADRAHKAERAAKKAAKNQANPE